MTPPPHSPAPTERGERAPVGGLGARETFRGLLLFAATGLAIWAFLLMLWPFRLPIAWALCLSSVSMPAYRKLSRTWQSPRLAALVMVLLVSLLILGPGLLVGALVVEEAQSVDLTPITDEMQIHLPSVTAGFEQVLVKMGVPEPPEGESAFDVLNSQLAENLPTLVRNVVTGPIGENLLAFALKPFVFLFSLLITLVTLYFVYCDSRRLRHLFVDVSPLDRLETEMILESLRSTTSAAIVGGVLVALLQGALGALMFAIADIPSPVLWGLVTAICSLFPFGGTALVWIPVAGYLFATGQVGYGVFVTVFGVVIVGGVDNLLRPWLMTKTGAKDVHPMLLFFAILSGVGLFGMSGIVFGPLLLALLTTMGRIYRRHFAPPTPAAVTDD